MGPVEEHAPEAYAAFRAVGAARAALEVDDYLDERVDLFAGQFGVDVSLVDDDLRRRFLAATGPRAFEVAQVIYVDDYWPRTGVMAVELTGQAGYQGPTERHEPRELWPIVEEFLRAVARLDAVDPVTTELVRLRGARQHECRLCKSRRSVDAIRAGADDATFDAVDHYAESDLPDHVKAALAITDTMIWSPYAVPRDVAELARRHLTPAQIVEVVLDVTRNAANKIAVALGADAAAVTDGVELFTTDEDGNLTIVEHPPR